MKTCSNCTLEKPLTEFHLKRGKPQAQCKKCRAEYMAKHYKTNLVREKATRKVWYEANKLSISEKSRSERHNNPTKVKEVNFRRNLRKYGITADDFNNKLVEQNNLCSICKKPFIDTPHIDHCHRTGLFRGILHPECNTALGLLKEDIAIFEGGIAYLKKYKK